MVTSRSVAVPAGADKAQLNATPEMIDRMAAELRARSDTDLPHTFYVAQVRRQLIAQASQRNSGPPAAAISSKVQPSVFHAWAMPE